MKKSIILIILIVHIMLAIALFYVGKQYEFVASPTNSWLANLILALVLFCIVIFLKSSIISKLPNLLLILYSVAILLIAAIAFYKLPNYTYVEAREMIERTTGETTRYNKGDFPKGQEGMYYIYTDTSVYIVNAETGDYVKRLYE
ncbi:hypothetical protein A0U40_00440 [[Bacillus] sp. KCTC 13219]|nr:hypothetical protein A0U40_00440 [[Bacillus] sp. KCTC 13219]